MVRYVRLGMPATEVDAELTAMRRISLVTLAVGVPGGDPGGVAEHGPARAAGAGHRRRGAGVEGGRPWRAVPRDFGPTSSVRWSTPWTTWPGSCRAACGDLSQDRARIDAIVAGMIEGVLVVDSEGHIQRINAAARKMLGVGEAVMGKPFTARAA